MSLFFLIYYAGKVEGNPESRFNSFITFLANNWILILIVVIILMILGFLALQFSSRILFHRMRKEREELKEKSSVKEMQNSVFR